MDIEVILAKLSATAKAKADERALRDMRTILSEPEFQRQLREFVSRAHNQPDARAEIAFILREARFSFRERATDLRQRHNMASTALVGGGSATIVSTLLALSTQVLAFPALAVLPLALGLYATWKGYADNRRLALEILILDDIVELLDAVLVRLEARVSL